MKPFEHRPTHPLEKGPRPGSRMPPYKVGNDETLESVAKKFGLSVDQLNFHNFHTTNVKEINWYLHHHVGCTLPTRDQKNWRFSRAASPGLIYIPLAPVPHPVPIRIPVPKPVIPVDISVDGDSPFLPADVKFTLEFRIPPEGPADLGYLVAQARINVEGEVKQQGGSLRGKISIRKDQLRAAVEAKIIEDTKATFAVKFEDKLLKAIAEAAKSGSKWDFVKAVTGPFEAQIKTTYRWKKLSVTPEIGGEFSETPVAVRLSGTYEDDMFFEGCPFHGAFTVKVGFNVGLSKKGWAWLADKVGRPALRWFLTQGGRAFATVTSEGVLTGAAIIGGAVIATAAMTSLIAWAIGDANRKAKLDRYARFYVEAYKNFVFGYDRPTSVGILPDDNDTRVELVLLGEKDALLDARATLAKANHPAARGTDQQAIAAFSELLMDEFNGDVGVKRREAQSKLWRTLEEKAKQVARR